MNNIQYFNAAWGDIKNSPGWFGKLCLLALLNFIPIFGQIVTFGYLYGWAREIAWGTHEPMPTRIFANEDGKLYRRGWFVFVLVFVVGLIASIVMSIGQGMQGAGMWGLMSEAHRGASALASGFGTLIYLIGLVGGILLSILAWIGSMRISIYDRLSAGFQLGKIWKMFRHDTGGIMRIFGMDLLFGFIIGIILSIVLFIIIFLVIFAGVASLAASGYSFESLRHLSDTQALALVVQVFLSAGLVGFFGILIASFLSFVGELFVMLLVARAMGYWTMQFDVPKWRGQDDPMPFELVAPAPGVPPVNPTAAGAQGYSPYAQQQPAQPMQPAQAAQPAQQAPASPIIPVADAAAGVAAGVAAFQVDASSHAEAVPEAYPEGSTFDPNRALDSLDATVNEAAAEPLASDPMPGFSYGMGADDQPSPWSAGPEAETSAIAAEPTVAVEPDPEPEIASGEPDQAPATMGAFPVAFTPVEEPASPPEAGGSEAGDAHGAHGVDDGDAGHAHIGEDGEPHVGQPEGGQD